MNRNPDGDDQSQGAAAWHQRAEMALASVIAADRLITYAELADAASIPSPHRIHKLTLWLETTMEVDHRAGAPLRTARVVSRNRCGLPAPGFFIKCRELGLYDGPVDGPVAEAFHLGLLGRVL